MTKKEFIAQYGISDAMPIDPSRRALPAEAFASAITEFMDKRFCGAIQVDCKIISAQAVLVCAEYVAYFFKTLLTSVYGRVMLRLSIFSDSECLHMNIDADDDFPIADGEMRELIRLARNAGLDIRPEPSKIRLSVSFTPATLHRVYAVSTFDGRRIMLGKLVEIFYHGELINPDPPPPRPMPKPIKNRPSKRKTKKEKE